MLEFISRPWPWYVGGTLLGLTVPILLLLINQHFGVSSTFRHVCAAVLPVKAEYFKYDWKKYSWNLFLVAGVIIGAAIGSTLLNGNSAPNLSEG